MRIVLLTNGSTHGRRILEELKKNRVQLNAVIVERQMSPPRPSLSQCLRELGYQTTLGVLWRQVAEALFPNLPALPYRRFAAMTRRVTDLNSATCEALLRDLRADLIVLGGARILKRPILDRARVAVLNAHPGLLPSYRGNDVIAWALHNGDPVGVTVHVVDAGIDTGPILMRRELPRVEGESIRSLKIRAEALAATMMSQVVGEIVGSGRVTPIPVSGPRGPLYRSMPPEMRAEVERKLSER